MQQAVLAMSLQEELILSDDEESDEEGGNEACGGTNEEVYDDGELQLMIFYKIREAPENTQFVRNRVKLHKHELWEARKNTSHSLKFA